MIVMSPPPGCGERRRGNLDGPRHHGKRRPASGTSRERVFLERRGKRCGGGGDSSPGRQAIKGAGGYPFAVLASATREFTSSLRKIERRWASTVYRDISSRSPISRLVKPSVARVATLCSVSVRTLQSRF